MDCNPGLQCHWNSHNLKIFPVDSNASDAQRTPDAVAFHLPKVPRPPPVFFGKDVLTIGASMESTQHYPQQRVAWRNFDIVMTLSSHSDVPLHYLGVGDQLQQKGINISLEGVEKP